VGVLLLAGGFGLLALPALTVALGRRLPASEWARLCQLALACGATVAEAALVLYALPTVLRAGGVPALAAMCQRAVGGFLPGGSPAGWAAATAAASVAALGAYGGARARRDCRAVRAEPWLGEHQLFEDYDLVVLPTERVIAVSVAGQPDQILISHGLVEALAPAELDMVVRHEAAHLERGHQRWLRLAAALDHGFAFFWPLRRSTAVLRAALEHVADDGAAGDAPEKRRLLRSALLGVTAMSVGHDLAAFSAADTVVARLDALERARPHPSAALRSLLYLPGAAIASTVLVAVAAWGGEARMLIAMAGRCPL